jgi:hypothetical protein
MGQPGVPAPRGSLPERRACTAAPRRYLALRRVLTYAATFGMGITASYYVNQELDRLKRLEQELEKGAAGGAAAQ